MRSVLFPGLAAMITACAGGDDATPDGLKARVERPPDLEDAGTAIYAGQCVLCHGRDGRLGINGAKDLTLSLLTREEMILIVSEGKGLMMPYEHVLSRQEIEAVVDHVHTMKAPS